MAYIRHISERHQITIPPSLLKEVGAPPYGGLFSIKAEKGKIILEPKKVVSEDWTDEDFKLLDKLVQKQLRSKSYTTYKDPKEAKKHLDRWRK